MLNITDTILNKLKALDLSREEAKLYVELLRKPNTHLQLSHLTGINRTKVYRLIENLEKKSLVSRRIDDRGMFLTASDPSVLEVGIIDQESKTKKQRTILTEILPLLKTFTTSESSSFLVRTYEGIEGLKQMCWHELQTKGELLSLGGQTIEDLIMDHRWAEKHRALSVESGYRVREIINHDIDLPTFTENKEFMNRYQHRQIKSKDIYFNEQIITYNDTVAIYHWRENQKIGIEIVSKSFANFIRQTFEHLWEVAGEEKNNR